MHIQAHLLHVGEQVNHFIFWWQITSTRFWQCYQPGRRNSCPATVNAISAGSGEQIRLNLRTHRYVRAEGNVVPVSFCHCSSRIQTQCEHVFLTQYKILCHNGCILFFHCLYNLKKMRSALARGKKTRTTHTHTFLSITLLYLSQLIYSKVLCNEGTQ